MRLDLENLPSDISLLHQLVREMAGVVDSRDGEIERLQAIIRKLQRAQFGPRSERLDPDQRAVALDDLDADIARIRESPSEGRQAIFRARVPSQAAARSSAARGGSPRHRA